MKDLIVIGAGTARANAARKCASNGWGVSIVDALPYGGACALHGCDPKKMVSAYPSTGSDLGSLL